MKKFFISIFFLFNLNSALFCQNNLIQWQKSYGGTSYDGGNQIKQTSDNGYVVCGYSWSTDGDVKGHHGTNGWAPDGWIMKLNASGDTMWTKSLGGTDDDYANAIIETSDGNFVVALQSQSNDGDVSVNKGWWDYWVVKLSPAGSIIWEKSYGGSGSDYANSVVEATDGNYVIAGYSASTNYDLAGSNKGGDDFWIIKVNSSTGAIIWKKNYGGSYDDNALSIANTNDSGFVVAGFTSSSDKDVTVNNGYDDFWVVKLDSLGAKQWQKSMGGDYYDDANSVVQASDGSYLIAGSSNSAAGTGDVSSRKGSFDYDYWVVKLSNSGTQIEWEKSYGGTMHDYGFSIVPSTGSGYFLAGFSESNDSDIVGNHGSKDYWVAQLDTSGAIQWSRVFGGDSLEYCFGAIQANDGGYAIAGFSQSSNGDVTKNQGKEDLWLVKTFCNPPVIPEVCLVTVDSTSTKNLIVWEKPPIQGAIDSFRVYREVSLNYVYLGGVAYSDLSKFTDNTLGANPQITSYKYKISTVDSCGNESPLSAFHKTIHLTTNAGQFGTVNLIWDNYSGFTSNFSYYILRDTTNTGNFEVIDSVPNSNSTYTDIFAPILNIGNYMIEVLHPSGGCIVTKSAENHNSSRSNRGNFAPPGNGVKEAAGGSGSWRVYPNPSNGMFTVIGHQSSVVSQIKIYNVLGEVVFQSTIVNPQSIIDISNQPKGIYLVKLTPNVPGTEQEIVTKKIIIH